MKAQDLQPSDIGTEITVTVPRFEEDARIMLDDPTFTRGPFREITGTITGLSTRSTHHDDTALCSPDTERRYHVESVKIRIDDRETIELPPMHDLRASSWRIIEDEQNLRDRNLHNLIVKSHDGINFLVINGTTSCPLHAILNGENREENTYGVECLGKQLYPLEILS